MGNTAQELIAALIAAGDALVVSLGERCDPDHCNVTMFSTCSYHMKIISEWQSAVQQTQHE